MNVFLWYQCNFSAFISDFIYLSPLSFFLGESHYRFINFIFFKNQACLFIFSKLVVSLIFCIVLKSLSLTSTLIFIIYFLLLTLDFVLFLVTLGVRLD